MTVIDKTNVSGTGPGSQASIPAPESFRTRLLRWQFNLHPAYRRSGGRITYVAGDLHYLRLKVSLSWRTRNYVGTIFGGCIYGAVDPVYMILFIKLLGCGYVVWDKAAAIRYRKPARSTLTAEFYIPEEELSQIREGLAQVGKMDRTYRIDLRDQSGMVCATIEKTLHFRKK